MYYMRYGTYLLAILIMGSCSRATKEYHEDGNLSKEYQLKKGVRNGFYYEYFKNGNTKVSAVFKNGKLHGSKKVFYPNGNIKWEANYEGGLENGPYIEFSPNGSIISEANFRNGKLDGEVREYYALNKLKKIVEFKDGHEHGSYKTFYANGAPSLVASRTWDSTYYFVKYDSTGQVLNHFRKIDLSSSSDTATIGNPYCLNVSIAGPDISGVSVRAAFAREPILDEMLLAVQEVSNLGLCQVCETFETKGEFILTAYVYLDTLGFRELRTKKVIVR